MNRLIRHSLPLLMLTTAILFTGCIAVPETDNATPLTIKQMNNAYEAKQFQQAYKHALVLMKDHDPDYRALAYYTAAKCNMKLNNNPQALTFMTQASQSAKDKLLLADSYAELGIIYGRMNKNAEAAANYLKAAKTYPQGKERANAYYYAGISQQKMGQLAEAKKSFFLARSSNANMQLLQQINSRISVNGYTIQIGAYSSKVNAIKAAQEVSLRSMTMNHGKPKIAEIADKDNKTVYRVQIGSFSSYKSANYAKRLLGVSDAIVVPLTKK
ncbi:SPOR domain-containing protein [Planctomycetota bacterium]|nr:SPOR domain-containing protein [Planctomycetota bacterium]